MILHKTTGILKYDILYTDRYKGYKLTVEYMDPGIALFYRSLIPKYKYPKPPMHSSHISVVRKEIPVNLEAWNKYQGERVEILYDPYIFEDKTYFWLNCYSHRLEDIREELGLVNRKWDKGEDDEFKHRLHITIANKKEAK